MINFVAAAAACSRQRVFCVSLGSRLSRQFKARGPVVSPALSRPLLFNGVKTVNKTTKMAADVPANEAVENNPGYCDTPDLVTTRYHVQQTMFKIKDPKASLEFYSKVLGMTLLKRLDFPEGKFTLYFLGFEQPAKIPKDPAQRTAFLFECKATIQLTHNWGTESDATFKGYHTDNDSGLIGITVDDVYKACKRFEGLGVEFAKRPDEGNMKGLAFIKDPDGYKIEIFDAAHMIAMINE